MSNYCMNDPCETEALYYYIPVKGASRPFWLCYTCAQAFELGQENTSVTVWSIYDEEDEDDQG